LRNRSSSFLLNDEISKPVSQVCVLRVNLDHLGTGLLGHARDVGRGAYGHVVSTRPLLALPLAQKYARRFSGAAGFRDTKPLGGVAAARIAEGPAWARLFARVAAAVCVLTQLGTHLGGRPQRPVWLRQVRSRRRGRTELRLVSIVCPQLDQVAGLWDLLTLHATLNLEAA